MSVSSKHTYDKDAQSHTQAEVEEDDSLRRMHPNNRHTTHFCLIGKHIKAFWWLQRYAVLYHFYLLFKDLVLKWVVIIAFLPDTMISFREVLQAQYN